MLKQRNTHSGIVGALLLCLGAALLLVGCEQRASEPQHATRDETPAPSREAISPLPLSIDLDPDRVALGKMLFEEPRLSHDGSVSCATCHPLDSGGVDHLARSVGINGQTGTRNTPTVFNSGFNFRQFWDGRAMALEDQVDGPLTSYVEMGSSWSEVLDTLTASSTYRALFAASYPSGVTEQSVRDAIAVFERSLVTPNARFDHFLQGDQAALSADEIDGYHLFRSYGCVSCHQGVNVGGNMFQRLGVIEAYVPRLDGSRDDPGRLLVTGDARDDHVFKVPSLRNVAITAPYFHDGSQPTLESAVLAMGHYQLGRQLTSIEIQHLVAFLRTLTGEYEGRPLT